MREIKFRVYCGVPYGIERGIHKVEVISFEDETVEFYAIDPHDNQRVNFCYPFSEVEIMQFTGLIDKKGVEVYEGDIVRNSLTGDANARVVFYSNALCVDVPDSYRDGLCVEIREDTELEVVGNIYEKTVLEN